MARLKTAGLALAMAMAMSAHAAFASTRPEESRWSALIAIASARYGIPANWIARVMEEESGGRTRLLGQPIRSRAGAIGLMQLMPRSWEEMRSRYGLGRDPDDPRDNVMAGTAYLRLMYDRFGFPGMFGAYNAGPARYTAYLQGRRPLPTETANYVRVVTRTARPAPTSPAFPASLFALRIAQVVGETPVSPHQQSSLFAIAETSSSDE